MLAVAAPALAVRPFIHAHRGGSLEFGKPVYPENTLPAFAHARVRGLRAGAGREAHRGPRAGGDPRRHARPHHALHRHVAARTFAQLRADCPLGHPRHHGTSCSCAPATARRAPIPKLSEVLALAKQKGARLNLEIKNHPTDPDFDGTDRLRRTRDGRDRGGALPALAPDRAVASGRPNLDRGQERGSRTPRPSLLTLGSSLGASTPPAPPGTTGSHRSGRSRPSHRRGARGRAARRARTRSTPPRRWPPPPRAGVDELITNDPLLARRAEAEVEAAAAADPAAALAERLLAPPGRPHARHDRGPAARAATASRVFAMQLKQEARHVETYASFRTKIECMIRECVLPRLVHGAPERGGLQRGRRPDDAGHRLARRRGPDAASDPASICPGQGFPCATVGR